MKYVVVMRDHDGEWHGLFATNEWGNALCAHGGAIATLVTIDYYEMCGPDEVKIIRADEPNYGNAQALNEATA